MLSNLQKAVLNALNSNKTENFSKLSGFFNYIDKNQTFPYIFYSIKNVKNLSTFSKHMYSCSLVLSVYDKNTSDVFVNAVLDEVKYLFENINNFQVEDFKVVDILLENMDVCLESNNSIWKGEIVFNIFLEC